jgi:hypothetical protein
MTNDKTADYLQKVRLDENVLSELNFIQTGGTTSFEKSKIAFNNIGASCLTEMLSELNDFILSLRQDSEVVKIKKSEVLKHLQLVRELKAYIFLLRAPKS